MGRTVKFMLGEDGDSWKFKNRTVVKEFSVLPLSLGPFAAGVDPHSGAGALQHELLQREGF